MNKIVLYYHTLKYLKFQQIFYRIWYKLFKPRPNQNVSKINLRRDNSTIKFLAKEYGKLTDKTATFLNHSAQITQSNIWNSVIEEKLWLYNLHYFDLLNSSDITVRQNASALFERWLKENPPFEGNGWEPYPISLRIVNLIKYHLTCTRLSEESLHSLYLQSRYLFRTCEYHILGNHLFENYKALCFAGIFFAGKEAEKWNERGFEGLKEQISEQILVDGGHFELSPMYHCIILEGLLDIQVLFSAYTMIERFPWQQQVEHMLYWLVAMQRNANSISYFNDAANAIVATPKELFDYAQACGYPLPALREKLIHFESSGYSIMMLGDAKCICDTAQIGPGYLPGHAHADSLSFELMLDNIPIIVNLGTSCYGISERRLFERGTVAHSTATINQQNSSHIWSGFRVAQRANTHVIEKKQFEDSISIRAQHDGYTKMRSSVIHERQWQMDGNNLTITDKFLGTYKTADVYYHLHPDVKIMDMTEYHVSLKLKNDRIVNVYSQEPIKQIDNEYAVAFGMLQQTKSLCVHLTGKIKQIILEICW